MCTSAKPAAAEILRRLHDDLEAYDAVTRGGMDRERGGLDRVGVGFGGPIDPGQRS